MKNQGDVAQLDRAGEKANAIPSPRSQVRVLSSPWLETLRNLGGDRDELLRILSSTVRAFVLGTKGCGLDSCKIQQNKLSQSFP